MSLFKAIVSLLIALPELIRLVKNLEKKADHKAKIAKVKQDVKKINDAYENGDEKALNEIFNS